MYTYFPGEKPYACSFCTKKFSQKQNMKIHEKTHLNEKNFECDICGRTFLRKWGLQVIKCSTKRYFYAFMHDFLAAILVGIISLKYLL